VLTSTATADRIVVVANRGANNVTALLGKGDGTFATTTHLNSFATGRSPYDVAVGDFNRDGRVDSVTTNFEDRTISVLLAEEPRFADLALSLQSSATSALAGATVRFDLQVGNLGPDPALNVVLQKRPARKDVLWSPALPQTVRPAASREELERSLQLDQSWRYRRSHHHRNRQWRCLRGRSTG
jgi:hypothetical protein